VVPLNASPEVQKLFSESERARIAKFTSGERRFVLQLPRERAEPIKDIRWPETIAAAAAAGGVVCGYFLPAFPRYPWLSPLAILGVVAIGVGIVFQPLLLKAVAKNKKRREDLARHLDEEDELLARAAAIVRFAGLCRPLAEHRTSHTDVGHMYSLAHGNQGPILQAAFQNALTALHGVARIILSGRPALDQNLLNEWATVLKDRAQALHTAINAIVMLAPTLPHQTGEPHQHMLNQAYEAYERYKEFWLRFAEGSGEEVRWNYGDPLQPDNNTTLTPLRLPAIPSLPAKT
jgi:hypothetical protein